MLAYAFHDVQSGYQKIGTYEGNGSAGNETTIVETGFEVAWLMLKSVDSSGNWRIIDNKRDTSNPRANYINADTSGQEETAYNSKVNFLANGFQLASGLILQSIKIMTQFYIGQ